jgi:hypothetical protein
VQSYCVSWWTDPLWLTCEHRDSWSRPFALLSIQAARPVSAKTCNDRSRGIDLAERMAGDGRFQR